MLGAKRNPPVRFSALSFEVDVYLQRSTKKRVQLTDIEVFSLVRKPLRNTPSSDYEGNELAFQPNSLIGMID